MPVSSDSLLAIFLENPSICTDTRKLKRGDIYLGLRGERFDGNAFAAKALEAGAAYAVVDNPEFIPAGDKRYIRVANTLTTLQQLATAYRRTFDIPVLALTGSNGKTTTKELIASILETEKKIHATQGNYNNHIGVPLTILSMPRDTEIAVIEMGTNQPGDIPELVQMTQPTHGLITNIGAAHLEKLGDLDGVLREKGALFDFIRTFGGIVFRNDADERLRSVNLQPYAVSYGTKESGAYFEIISQEWDSMKLNVYHPAWTGARKLNASLSGEYNALNVLAAMRVAYHFGVSWENIAAGVKNYVPGNQRSQILRRDNYSIWLDAYNANPSSMEASVRHFLTQANGKSILILGDMNELGENEEEQHADIGRLVNQYNPYLTIGVGRLSRHILNEIESPTKWFSNVEEASEQIAEISKGANWIMLKASRSIKLEKLLEII